MLSQTQFNDLTAGDLALITGTVFGGLEWMGQPTIRRTYLNYT